MSDAHGHDTQDDHAHKEHGDSEKPKHLLHDKLPKKGFHHATTDELLGYIESYYTNPVLREQVDDKKESAKQSFKNIYMDHMKKKRGEHATNKGAPKSYGINSDTEAEEILYDLAKEAFKQEHSEGGLEAALKTAIGKEKIIEDFSRKLQSIYGQNVDYHTLKKLISKDKRYLHKNLIKNEDALEGLSHVDEDYHLKTAQTVLMRDEIKHRSGLEKKVNGILVDEKQNKIVKDNTDMQDLFGILSSKYQSGKLNENALHRYEHALKDYKSHAADNGQGHAKH